MPRSLYKKSAFQTNTHNNLSNEVFVTYKKKAKYESRGEATVKSQLNRVAAKSKGTYCLMQIGEYPVANKDVDQHNWHAGRNRLRIFLKLNHTKTHKYICALRTPVLAVNTKYVKIDSHKEF